MDDLKLLSSLELFEPLDHGDLVKLASTAHAVALRRNDVLFNDGDDADELYVVRSGRIAIFKTSADGKESVIALMEPGDLFGDMPLFDRMHRSAGARATEASKLLGVPYPPIRELLAERPELLWRVVEMLSRRLRNIDEALADSMFLDVTGRTAKQLLELSGDSDVFSLPVTQEELAGLVGASRERVNKSIAAFVRLGWIEQSDRRYKITDREQLARRAR